MKLLLKALWTEPAVFIAAVVGVLQFALAYSASGLGAALAALVVSLGGGAATRARVKPQRVDQNDQAGYTLIEVGVLIFFVLLGLAIAKGAGVI